MGLLDWLRYGPPMLARPAATAPPRAQKLDFVTGYQAALTSEMLVHGPGATLSGSAPRGDGNSAVFACLSALSTSYVEAPLRVYRERAPGQREALPAHPLQAFLDAPNPYLSALEIWSWVTWAKHVDGNAFLRKERGRAGNVVRLWPMSPARVEIRSEGNDFITRYRWFWAAGKYDDIAPADVVHFRLGLDDRDPRRGLSALQRLVRAITTDERASDWTDTLLANYALPGLMIKTKRELSQEQAQALAEQAQWLYGAERRGKVGVLGGDADLAPLGFSPEQMNLRALHSVPEERVSAVLRVPAIIAGLGAGLDAATYANARQAREFFTESTLTGLWAADDVKLQAQLVPDFTSDPLIRVYHDITDVRAFQEDETQKYGRLKEAVGGPFLTVNEARADLGLKRLPDGDVLFVPTTVIATPSDALVPEPPAVAGPTALPAGGAPGEGTPIDIEEVDPAVALAAARGLVTLVKADGPPPVRIGAADLAAAQAYWADDPLVAPLLGAQVTPPKNGRH
jgi:HK97 family phage portal protein